MKKIILAIGFGLFLTSCQKENTVHDTDVIPHPVVAERYTIKVSESFYDTHVVKGDMDDNHNIHCSNIPGIALRNTFNIGGKYEDRQRREGLHLYFDVDFEPSKSGEIFDILSNVQGIDYIETIPKARIQELPNDPKSGLQWHYYYSENAGINTQANIFLSRAWDKYSVYGNNNIVVAVIDSGVEYSHEDLHSNMWINDLEFNGQPGVDDDGNGYIDDIYGYNFITKSNGVINPGEHGTHVAGTIAAVNNNDVGVCGIAGGWYPQQGARIMSCQIIDGEDGSGNAEKAFQYAADNGAVIAQNSWGYEKATSMPISLKAAIDYFIKYAGCDENGNQLPTSPMKGGIVIFAAGNDAKDKAIPAEYEKVLAVASFARTGKAAYYTNYGQWVDVSAPGGDQQESYMYGGVYSTTVNNKYTYLQGTSMACPHVSGIAALVLSKINTTGFTSQMLFDNLIASCDSVLYNWNPNKKGLLGAGLVRADNALALLSTTPPLPIDASRLSMSVVSNTISCSTKVPVDPDDMIARYINLEFSCAGHKTVVAKHDTHDSTEVKFKIPGLDFETQYNVVGYASDFAGNQSGITTLGKITTGENNAPVITSDYSGPISLKKNDKKSFNIQYYEPDGHAFTIEFNNKGNNAAAHYIISDDMSVVRIDALQSEPGSYNCSFIVRDEYGMASELEIYYEIEGNSAPTVIKNIEDRILDNDELIIELKDIFHDDDDTDLSYDVVFSEKGIASGKINQGKLAIKKGTSCGYATVNITASDPVGASASTTFNILNRGERTIEWDIYPNPVTSTVNIRLLEQTAGTLIFTDINGLEVKSLDTTIGNMFNPTTIDCTSLQIGLYKISFINAEHKKVFETVITKI